ncbi:hypothetical protein ABK040_015880 [Willaertia magna]
MSLLSSPKTRSARSRRKTTTKKTSNSSGSNTATSTDETKVDIEQYKRDEAHKARFEALERDNYFIGSVGGIDDEDEDDEEWKDGNNSSNTNNQSKSEGGSSTKKRKKATTTSKDGKKKVKFVKRKLEQVLYDIDHLEEAKEPNYLSITAPPSLYPKRNFCSITGFQANYTCPITGQRYLNVAAYEHVKKQNHLE